MISTNQLKRIYYTNNCKDASQKIGVSVPTLLKMIDKAGIERKGSGRPYKKIREPENTNVYLSTGLSDIFIKQIRNPKGLVFFVFLVTDRLFMKNNWNGESNVHIDNQFGDFTRKESIDLLDKLVDKKILSDYSLSDLGFLSANILDRKRFVMTESEYIEDQKKRTDNV